MIYATIHSGFFNAITFLAKDCSCHADVLITSFFIISPSLLSVLGAFVHRKFKVSGGVKGVNLCAYVAR